MIRWRTFLVIAMTGFLCSQAPYIAASPTASVEGVVLRAGANEPIEDALVSVSGLRADGTRFGPHKTYTDAAGRFRLSVGAGSYTLNVASHGYVSRGYPAIHNGLTLEDGQTVRDLVIRLTPTGVVSGRITDHNGGPLAHMPVQLMRSTYGDNGQRKLEVADFAETDDRGEYRFFYVTPGPYYLCAGNAIADRQDKWKEEKLHEAFAYAFFPGVPESRQAVVLVVEPGSDRRGIDMALDAPARYSVRGRIVDVRTGKPPDSPAIHLSTYDASLNYNFRGEFLKGEAGTYADGRFEFRSVTPGHFTVMARVEEDTADEGSRSRAAYSSVTVIDRDVENVVLVLPVNETIAGIWRRDTPPPATARQPSITMTETLLGPREAIGATASDDGSFAIPNVTPGEYKLSTYPRQPGGYLKEARFDGVDILYRKFRVLGNETGGLDLLFGVTNGVVEGTASRAATVVLVPKQRDRTELIRTTSTDAKNQFRFTNVIPDEYNVFAWDEISGSEYLDPDLLAGEDEPSVSVTESSTAAVDVRVRNRIFELAPL